MIIHVFTVTEESYRYGDFNDSYTKYFKTIELRDEYYNSVVDDYMNRDLIELDRPGDYSDEEKWAYHIEKGEEDLQIIEEKIGKWKE